MSVFRKLKAFPGRSPTTDAFTQTGVTLVNITIPTQVGPLVIGQHNPRQSWLQIARETSRAAEGVRPQLARGCQQSLDNSNVNNLPRLKETLKILQKYTAEELDAAAALDVFAFLTENYAFAVKLYAIVRLVLGFLLLQFWALLFGAFGLVFQNVNPDAQFWTALFVLVFPAIFSLVQITLDIKSHFDI